MKNLFISLVTHQLKSYKTLQKNNFFKKKSPKNLLTSIKKLKKSTKTCQGSVHSKYLHNFWQFRPSSSSFTIICTGWIIVTIRLVQTIPWVTIAAKQLQISKHCARSVLRSFPPKVKISYHIFNSWRKQHFKNVHSLCAEYLDTWAIKSFKNCVI